MKKISGILLAGGKSSRMGTNKAFLSFKNNNLYEYPLQILEAFCSEILISAPLNTFSDIKYRHIPDLFPGIGPIGGIYSCLQNISHTHALVISCDIPLITESFIKFLLQQPADYDMIIGENPAGNFEPLAGIYSVSLIPKIKDNIKEKKNKITHLLQQNINANIISLKKEGFNPDIFMNINTKEDLQKAEQLYDKLR